MSVTSDMGDSSITFTNTFEDGTTDKITINHIQLAMTSNTKSRVKKFNETIAETDFPNRLVSKTGAKWKRISGVEIVNTYREYFF